jgi:hypothetical protein
MFFSFDAKYYHHPLRLSNHSLLWNNAALFSRGLSAQMGYGENETGEHWSSLFFASNTPITEIRTLTISFKELTFSLKTQRMRHS